MRADLHGEDDPSAARNEPGAKTAGRPSGLSRTKKIVFSIIYAALLLLLVEAALRLRLCLTYQARFFRPSTTFVGQYLDRPPEDAPRFAELELPQDSLRILLLGGSVIHPAYGTIQDALEAHLAAQGVSPVSIVNAAGIGHSSRDSFFKYELLDRLGCDVDVVVVYHAINEVRANCCPPDVFREDYSHYRWYQSLNITHRHLPWLDWTVIPYSIEDLCCRIRQRIRPRRYVPTDQPDDDWVPYGSRIKTAGSFEANLANIACRARDLNDRLVLLSFAHHLPDDYSLEAFNSNRLDYAGHVCPAELWGAPSNVVKGVEIHNQVTASLAAQHPEIAYLDMDSVIPKSAVYFDDICHLTAQGCELFATALSGVLAEGTPRETD